MKKKEEELKEIIENIDEKRLENEEFLKELKKSFRKINSMNPKEMQEFFRMCDKYRKQHNLLKTAEYFRKRKND